MKHSKLNQSTCPYTEWSIYVIDGDKRKLYLTLDMHVIFLQCHLVVTNESFKC